MVLVSTRVLDLGTRVFNMKYESIRSGVRGVLEPGYEGIRTGV